MSYEELVRRELILREKLNRLQQMHLDIMAGIFLENRRIQSKQMRIMNLTRLLETVEVDVPKSMVQQQRAILQNMIRGLEQEIEREKSRVRQLEQQANAIAAEIQKLTEEIQRVRMLMMEEQMRRRRGGEIYGL